MRLLKLVPFSILLLALSSGLTTLGTTHANAACCNPFTQPTCVRWWPYMVHGSVKVMTDQEGNKFIIKDNMGYSIEVTASQEVADLFKNEAITEDYGFSILDNSKNLIAFVPNSPNHRKTTKTISTIVEDYNKGFRQGAVKPTLPYKKKVTNASMTTR
ncbi:MAG: hypothetical protein QM706_15355 [Nitrospira sp.]